MFVDVVPNRNSRPTILIRQAYREGGKARKRTLANITKLPPDTVEKIRKILSGADPADAPVKLEDAFTISRSLQHGNAAAVLAALRAAAASTGRSHPGARARGIWRSPWSRSGFWSRDRSSPQPGSSGRRRRSPPWRRSSACRRP